MKRIFTRIILLFAACGSLTLNAQDPHFSQYFNAPFFVNPANAGNGIEYMRATLIYRNQWASVASPFVTEGLMVDKKVNKIGFGFLIVKNSAGKSSLKQLNLSGALSYNQPVGENNQFTGALQVGMMHKSFGPAEMTFDSQYAEDIGFDPSAQSGEIFTNTSITRPDVGAGFMWQRGFGKPKLKFKPFAGFAFSHLNKPSETFIVDNNKMPVKTTINFGAGIAMNENVEIKPSMIYMIQDHAHEFSYGAVTSFVLNNDNKFQVGLFNRKNDAIIAYAGYQVNQLFIGTSYDINVSGLKEVSHGNGGFEITISYIPKAKKKNKPAEHKAVLKTPVKKERMKKAVKAGVKPIELTVSVPDKLEAKPAPSSQKAIAKQATPETKPTAAAITPKIKPIVRHDVAPVDSKEITSIKGKKTNTPGKLKQPIDRIAVAPKLNPAFGMEKKEVAEQPVVAVQEEIKPVVLQDVAPVTSKEITSVKEKKANTPAKLKQPLDRIAVAPKLNPAFGIAKKEVSEKPVVITEPKTSSTIVEEPKAVVVVTEQPKAPVVETKVIAENKVIDTDGDGIKNDADECPYIKGSVRTNGCPDSDSDGIIDMKDNCPMEPGTLITNGCPDPKISIDKAMLIKNFNNIEFEIGKAVVKTTDVYDIIEYAIDIMYEHPNSHVILSGHTDSEGDELFNMKLSEQRTEVVKKYMIKKRIDESRIQTVDYGETMPLMDNSTEYGKSKNRRVEINILKASTVN